jgi:hypothetical protein
MNSNEDIPILAEIQADVEDARAEVSARAPGLRRAKP